MKKSNFITLLSGTISGMLFAIGMCMVLIPEQNAVRPGIIFGTLGILLGIITLFVRRRMEHKKPLSLNVRTVAVCLFGIFGALIFGVGMCFCMVWNHLILGTLIGCLGILLLLCLIPLTKGLK